MYMRNIHGLMPYLVTCSVRMWNPHGAEPIRSLSYPRLRFNGVPDMFLPPIYVILGEMRYYSLLVNGCQALKHTSTVQPGCLYCCTWEMSAPRQVGNLMPHLRPTSSIASSRLQIQSGWTAGSSTLVSALVTDLEKDVRGGVHDRDYVRTQQRFHLG